MNACRIFARTVPLSTETRDELAVPMQGEPRFYPRSSRRRANESGAAIHAHAIDSAEPKDEWVFARRVWDVEAAFRRSHALSFIATGYG